MGSDSDEGGAPPEYMYESALQALLSEDIRVDMRGVLKDIVTFANFQELSASVQSSLAKLLPEDDQTPDMFEQALRCPQLAEAVREMEESLEMRLVFVVRVRYIIQLQIPRSRYHCVWASSSPPPCAPSRHASGPSRHASGPSRHASSPSRPSQGS